MFCVVYTYVTLSFIIIHFFNYNTSVVFDNFIIIYYNNNNHQQTQQQKEYHSLSITSTNNSTLLLYYGMMNCFTPKIYYNPRRLVLSKRNSPAYRNNIRKIL